MFMPLTARVHFFSIFLLIAKFNVPQQREGTPACQTLSSSSSQAPPGVAFQYSPPQARWARWDKSALMSDCPAAKGTSALLRQGQSW